MAVPRSFLSTGCSCTGDRYLCPGTPAHSAKEILLWSGKYDEKALYSAGMKYVYCSAGKLRRTQDFVSRIKNVLALFPIILGVLKALFHLYIIFLMLYLVREGMPVFPCFLPLVCYIFLLLFMNLIRYSAEFLDGLLPLPDILPLRILRLRRMSERKIGNVLLLSVFLFVVRFSIIRMRKHIPC